MIKIQRITSFKTADLRAVNQLARQLAPETKRITPAAYQLLLKDKNSFLFAAKDDGKMVGMATLVITRIPTGQQSWIEDVVVNGAYRGQGIGEGLCKALIAAAGKNRSRKIKLTSRPERAAANALYQKLGFERYDTNVYRMHLK